MTSRATRSAKTSEFMLVRPELVRELGSANDALVLVRISFRCELVTQHTHIGPDGEVWWSASRDVLAAETGLSVDQVRHSLLRLERAGHLRVEEHRLGGNYDRTKSYRLAPESRVELGSVPDESWDESQQERAPVPTLPLMKTFEEIKTRGRSTGSGIDQARRIDAELRRRSTVEVGHAADQILRVRAQKQTPMERALATIALGNDEQKVLER